MLLFFVLPHYRQTEKEVNFHFMSEFVTEVRLLTDF